MKQKITLIIFFDWDNSSPEKSICLASNDNDGAETDDEI